ncbi:hypothetical protein GCK32_012459 [Trichostrongylus colubriformis]|uniref:Proteasome subunit beta type-5 n=1 Tax=Trichostrongylus colubriformis TaxID=6319 RepID=A0AAN8IRD5_TRICO
MASRGGVRAAGTDGTDFQHRQRIAAHYHESAQYKFILKWFFAPHVLILIFMWAKVGSEVLRKEFGWRSAFFERLDMPSAYPWEYVWCFSFIPIICAMLSFSKNKVKLINYHYYGHFVFGILPCMIGLGGQLPELLDYIKDQESSNTPTFKLPASKSVMKILDIGDRIVATMAGGAADCQFWTRTVAKYCNLFELREKTQITVSAASKYFANVLYGYRGMGLSVGSMIAGYDKRGPQIFKVSQSLFFTMITFEIMKEQSFTSFKVDSDGDRCQLNMCSVGSGSLNAYGILDTHYKRKMTDEEALKLGRRAIMHATYRDSGSGGVCN